MDNFSHSILHLFYCKYTKYHLYRIILIKNRREYYALPLLYLHKPIFLPTFIHESQSETNQKSKLTARCPISPLSYLQCKAFHLNGVQTELKCKPNVKRCKRFVFVGHSPLLHHNALKTKAINHFQTDHILTRFVFPPLYRFGKFYLGIFHITHLFIEGVKIQKVL